MTVADATTTAHIEPSHVDTIVEMLQRGRRISEVIAAGLNVRDGWRKNDVIDVVSARRWRLDSDGRIPQQYRTAVQPPTDTVPGAPAPVAARPVSWPEHGTRTQPDPRLRAVPTGAAPPTDSASALLNAGKAHSQPRVRKLAEKAERALIDLRTALGAETEREKLRARLAELDAERDRLRARLAGPGRPPKARAMSDDQPKPLSLKPIEHGTERGARQHNLRRDPLCDECRPFQEVIVAKLRDGRKGTGA